MPHPLYINVMLVSSILRAFGFSASHKSWGTGARRVASVPCIAADWNLEKPLLLFTGKKGYGSYSHLFLIMVLFFHTGSCRFLVLAGRMMQTNLRWSSQKVCLSCTRENSMKPLLQLDQEITKKDVCMLLDSMSLLAIKDDA